jgi:predicted DCC family thiol-disulfide oxidoreductase YuxK
MKPILIYDGHCNMCIGFVKSVETYHQYQPKDYLVDMIPYQNADDLIKTYHLDPEELQQAFHFITPEGEVYKAGQAIDKLAEVYPLLKIGSGFFTTQLGENFYQFIAKNRYSVFGCQDECYVPTLYVPGDQKD